MADRQSTLKINRVLKHWCSWKPELNSLSCTAPGSADPFKTMHERRSNRGLFMCVEGRRRVPDITCTSASMWADVAGNVGRVGCCWTNTSSVSCFPLPSPLLPPRCSDCSLLCSEEILTPTHTHNSSFYYSYNYRVCPTHQSES